MTENASRERGPADRVVGDFELLRLLGQGGMGEVWEARQRSVGRLVALKLLPLGLAENPRAVLRFRREAEAGGRLQHPHIAVVYSAGLADGRLFIAQELIPSGRSLADWLGKVPRTERLPEEHFRRVAELVTQVARALHYAHEKGVIHRDVKPQNILVAPSGEAKLVDFGLAQVDDGFTLSQSGDLAGTYAYMSPEQARARTGEIDHRTDVFSLGATLYELLTLVPPFRGGSVPEIMERILNEAPEDPCEARPEVPRELAAACLRALAKRREDRFQSAEELACAVHPERRTAEARAFVPAARDPRRPRRAWRGWIAMTTAVAALGLLAWHRNGRESGPEVEPPRNFFEGLSAFPALAAFAREQVELYRARASVPLPGDALVQRLRETVVPSVVIEPGTSIESALRSIPSLSDFPFYFDVTAKELVVPTLLDLAHPIHALDLLELLLEPQGHWMAEDSHVVLAGAPLADEFVLETYAINDLMGLDFPERELRITLERNEKPWINSPEDVATFIQEDVAVDSWEEAGVSMSIEGPRLIITHRPRVQRQVAALLAGVRSCFFLNGCDKNLWDAVNHESGSLELDQALSDRVEAFEVDLQLVEPTLDAFVRAIEPRLGLDVLVTLPAELDRTREMEWLLGAPPGPDEPSTLSGPLKRLVRQLLSVRRGIVRIGAARSYEDFAARAYPVWDLVGSRRRLDAFGDLIEEEFRVISIDLLDATVRDNANPEVWEKPREAGLRFYQELMIVHAPLFVHRSIETLLAKLRSPG